MFYPNYISFFCVPSKLAYVCTIFETKIKTKVIDTNLKNAHGSRKHSGTDSYPQELNSALLKYNTVVEKYQIFAYSKTMLHHSYLYVSDSNPSVVMSRMMINWASNKREQSCVM